MNFVIENWIKEIVCKIKNEFDERLTFIGLQGSYKRKEANENSDIDLVVILNELTINDLKKYRELISQMSYKEKACGFISGKQEILNWEKSDLFQFYHDTQAIYGNIDYLLPLIKTEDIKKAIKIGACNIYHAGCHNFLYENSVEILWALYKASFFILQAKSFIEINKYLSSKKELIEELNGTDKEILQICIDKKDIVKMDETMLEVYSQKIIDWSSNVLQEY